MALRLSRFLPSAIAAFCAANIVAGTIIYLGIFSPQIGRQVVDGTLADAIHGFAGLDAQEWLKLLQGAAATSALLAAATLVPVIAFLAMAWGYRWRDARPIVLTGAFIGPLILAAGLLALSNNFSRSFENPVFLVFYLVLAVAGAMASLIFWLMIKPALPWLSHPN